MSLTEKQIEKIVQASGGGGFEESDGPYRIGNTSVWEVWVYNDEDDEYETQFVTLPDGGSPKYLENFKSFCGYVADMLDHDRSQLQAAAEANSVGNEPLQAKLEASGRTKTEDASTPLKYPEKVTPAWLWHNADVSLWWKAAGLIVAIFGAGFTAGHIKQISELFRGG